MHVEFEIHGCFRVPDGTTPVAGFRNLFRLPTGQVVSVQPVIEMASSAHGDDHRDLTFRQAESLGVVFEVHDRQSELVDEE